MIYRFRVYGLGLKGSLGREVRGGGGGQGCR